MQQGPEKILTLLTLAGPIYHQNSLPKVFQNYFLSLKQTHDHHTRSTTKQNYYVNPARKTMPEVL